jgi:hypothetical protein
MYTNHCHRVFTQLQLTNISSHIKCFRNEFVIILRFQVSTEIDDLDLACLPQMDRFEGTNCLHLQCRRKQ